MVFVGRNHPIYTEADRKTPKRVGNLVKSSSASLHGMLMAHMEEVQKYIKGMVKSTGSDLPMEEDLPPAFNEVEMAMQGVDHTGRAERQQRIEAERERNETRQYLNSMGTARY